MIFFKFNELKLLRYTFCASFYFFNKFYRFFINIINQTIKIYVIKDILLYQIAH